MHDAREIPSVSVVVPVLNGAGTIGDLLHALFNQAVIPQQMEIIIVDNASTDATRQIVGRFPQARLVMEEKRGPAAARNAGLRNARHDVILHCDADTLPSRRWVSELAQCFANRDVHLAAGKTLSYPPATPAERYLATAQLYEAEFNTTRPVLPFVCSMNMGVRRESAIAVGGWNEDMLTSEDVDFSTRVLARFPAPIRYAAEAVLFHRNRSTDEALKKQAWSYGEGVADTYRRYPSIVPWGVKQYLRLTPNIVGRLLAPAWLRAGKALGKADDSDIEHARYHRMWTRWFWGGFFSFYRRGEYRRIGGDSR